MSLKLAADEAGAPPVALVFKRRIRNGMDPRVAVTSMHPLAGKTLVRPPELSNPRAADWFHLSAPHRSSLAQAPAAAWAAGCTQRLSRDTTGQETGKSGAWRPGSPL